jgi:hypothetical protein
MRKLNVILLYIWTALAFAAASRAQVNKPYGEWFKIGVRVVKQQPIPFDLGHALLALDPDGRLLHTAATMIA